MTFDKGNESDFKNKNIQLVATDEMMTFSHTIIASYKNYQDGIWTSVIDMYCISNED